MLSECIKHNTCIVRIFKLNVQYSTECIVEAYLGVLVRLDIPGHWIDTLTQRLHCKDVVVH